MTKQLNQMTQSNSQDDLNNIVILNQAIEIATQVLSRLNIPAGSYTAEEVHKTITQKSGRSHNRRGHDSIFTKAFDDNEMYNIRFSYAHKLQSNEEKMMMPTRDIFKNIAVFERVAGIKKRDRHVWVKESPHTKVCTTVVDFPAKKTAHGMATIMCGVNKRNSECMVYMPRERKVLGICNSEYIYYNHCCKAESEVNLPDVAFKFKAAYLKQIYGRCTVDYYIDAKGSYSIVITNEEGWKTGINASLSEYEMQSVRRMVKVQETDMQIVSGYHSERYMNDAEVEPKKQYQEKISDDNDIPKDALKGVKESKETVLQERQPVVDINDVRDEILNDSVMSKETVLQERQPVVDINDVRDEIINDSVMSKETLPQEEQNEPTANDIPSVAVNGAKESVENMPTDSRKELKVKHPQNRVDKKRSLNKHLFSKTVNRHIKCHKKNKHH